MSDPKLDPNDPHLECVYSLLQAMRALREARYVASSLPNRGKLFAELQDAIGIVGQSITFIVVEHARKLDRAALGEELVR